jgi:prophage regulatory protein
MIDRLMRITEVAMVTGISRSTIYRLIANNEFPLPVSISSRRVGWRESAVKAWIEMRTESTTA